MKQLTNTLLIMILLLASCSKKNGVEVQYFSNGNKMLEVTYKDDERVEVKNWGFNGKLSSEIWPDSSISYYYKRDTITTEYYYYKDSTKVESKYKGRLLSRSKEYFHPVLNDTVKIIIHYLDNNFMTFNAIRLNRGDTNDITYYYENNKIYRKMVIYNSGSLKSTEYLYNQKEGTLLNDIYGSR